MSAASGTAPGTDFAVSFAIITSGQEPQRVAEAVQSIRALAMPQYEVLVVGGTACATAGEDIHHVAFVDEPGQPGWITRKKNLATATARHEWVVYFHDYHVFDADWYRGLCAAGSDWDIAMHRVLCNDGTRFFGWQVWDHPTVPRYFNVPYERHDVLPFMYFSGGYWMARRSVMLEAPLDERLRWGQAEDVEWSLRVRDRFRVRMNPLCVVRHTKPHAALAFCRQMATLEPQFEGLHAQAVQRLAAAKAALALEAVA
jgi:hypothetical protein